MDTLEKNLAFTFACFSISAAAFFFYLDVSGKYKSGKLLPVLLKAIASSIFMAIFGPWSYFVLVKSVVEDIKAKQATLSHLLFATLASFVPVVVMAAFSGRTVIVYHALAVIAISILTITVLLKKTGL